MNQYYFEDLEPGMRESLFRDITVDLIEAFATVTGDNNPVHVDAAYAATTRFGGQIAHGMLSAGFISAVLGTLLPGMGAIYMAQSLKFIAPVKVGDRVEARVEVLEKITEKNRVTFTTRCYVGDKLVVDGDAMVYVPSR